MLCLSRRFDETILIGNDVEVKIIGIKPHEVRLGISAPRRVTVLRGELLDRARACEPGQEGEALRTTDTIPGVHRDGRDGLPAGEAVDPDHEELLHGATTTLPT